ncbi:ABC transporter ATP-binding protein, partial [Devosia limi DSM 17137]
AKAISTDARVLSTYYPPAGLSVAETETVFAQIRVLSAKGVAVIFIAHKLDEIMELADRVTVLRDGQLIATGGNQDLTPDSIAQTMVGRELSTPYPPKHDPDADAPLLLSVTNSAPPALTSTSFEFRRRELPGLAGLIASRRTAPAGPVFG